MVINSTITIIIIGYYKYSYTIRIPRPTNTVKDLCEDPETDYFGPETETETLIYVRIPRPTTSGPRPRPRL